MAYESEIGRREWGKYSRKERWFHCAIGDEVVPESQTVIEDLPSNPAFGMRVCLKHKDEPSYTDNEIRMRRKTPRRTFTDNA